MREDQPLLSPETERPRDEESENHEEDDFQLLPFQRFLSHCCGGEGECCQVVNSPENLSGRGEYWFSSGLTRFSGDLTRFSGDLGRFSAQTT